MISIIIVNFNSKKYLFDCINSILNSKIPTEYEILIINNSKNENIDNFSSKIVKVFNLSCNLGFAKAANYGVSKSLGDELLFLNPDTLLESDTIKNMYNYINENTMIGVVGGKVLNSDKTYQLSSRRKFPNIFNLLVLATRINKFFPKSKVFGSYNYTNYSENTLMEVDSVSGACMFIKKDVFNSIGRYDESYFMYFEDTDLCLQLKKNNYKIVYYPLAKLTHVKGGSSFSSVLRKYYFYSSMNIFFNKNSDFSKDWYLIAKISSFFKFYYKIVNILINKKKLKFL